MSSNKPRVHYADNYIMNPVHPVTIDLVGCGGNGGIMMSCLASIHQALVAMGKPGLNVTVWDDDEVSQANIGRQMFVPSEIGLNKANAIVSRFNRCFGTDWDAQPSKYKYNNKTNIIITCVDNVKARKMIAAKFSKQEEDTSPEHSNYYWLDMGNSQSKGQVVLGSREIAQPSVIKYETVSRLPLITDLHRLTKASDRDSGPSCSLAEALAKQDLFINRMVATAAADILWKLLRHGIIEHHGAYVNLDNMMMVPIAV